MEEAESQGGGRERGEFRGQLLPGTTLRCRALGAQPWRLAFLDFCTISSHTACVPPTIPPLRPEWASAPCDQMPNQHPEHANRKQAFLISPRHKILNSPSIEGTYRTKKYAPNNNKKPKPHT